MKAIDKLYEKEIWNFRRLIDIEIIAFELSKYLEFYSDTKSNLKQVLNSALERENWYTDKDKESLLENSIELLKIKYNIEIVSTNPLRMNKKRK